MTVLRSGVTILRADRGSLDALLESMKTLTGKEILVGFPDETAERTDPDSGLKIALTNATIAYIQDRGAPEVNLPARPFMLPGITNAVPGVLTALDKAAKAVVRGASEAQVLGYFHQAGLAAQVAVRKKINEGIPPPLADATLQERARRGRKGAKKELLRRAQGIAPSTDFAKPLIDTGQLRNAVTYVIRDKD